MLNFAAIHYAPLLKWKHGERTALAHLDRQAKYRVLPIFLMPPPGSFDHDSGKILTPTEHIKGFGSAFERVWGGRFAFVDAAMMDSDEYNQACDGDHPLTVLLERARLPKGNVFCAPSTGLDRSARYQNAVRRFAERHTGFPLGLRVDLSATESSGFRSDLSALVRRLGVEPDRVVLSLEVTDYDLSSVEVFADLVVEILNSLPDLHRWRAIVLSLSGLPKKILVKCRETKLFPRWEWAIYRMVHARWAEGNLLRLPIFSDFGIDAAGFEPSRPVRPSAQLRYTTPGSYVITKGLSTKVGGYEAIYPVAQALMARDDFMGADFCYGDRRIVSLGKNQASTGNAATWKALGFNHHITLVDRELCALLGEPAVAPETTVREEQHTLL